MEWLSDFLDWLVTDRGQESARIGFLFLLALLIGAVPDLTIEPIAFSTMFDKPPCLLPGVVLALRSTPPRCR